jgi:uncharacterized C2H2 Zn-finger protein
MTEGNIIDDLFDHLIEYRLAICKECQHGVLPSQIKSHLQRAHRMGRKQAESVAEEVGSWAGLIQYASELEVPSQAVEPMHQLPVYADGLKCQLDPSRCRHIFRSSEAMRKHWHKAHDWSPASKGGRPSRIEEEKIQARSRESCQTVHCQRLLVQGQGSQYFEVQPPGEDGPGTVPTDGNAAWARVGEQMTKAWANVETRARNAIRAGEKDEVNPWVERTQWLPYLVGMDRLELMACIEEPIAEPDPREEQQAEPVEVALWEAMDGLAQFSQELVISRVGVFVQLEAIRTEKH